ncbi:MAG: hypothetical protein ACK5Y1_01495 [Betaproteobacteria bacterium]
MTQSNLTHKYSSLGRVAVALRLLGLFTQVSDAQEAGRWSVAGGTAALPPPSGGSVQRGLSAAMLLSCLRSAWPRRRINPVRSLGHY